MPKIINIGQGDTLSQIAEREGSTVDEIFQANVDNEFVKDRDTILAGGTLNIPDKPGTTTEEMEGIGTLTRVEKKPLETNKPTDEIVTEDVIEEDVTVDDAPDVPTFGTTEASKTSITEAFNTINKQIEDIEKDILSSKTASAEEKQLLKDLQEKKQALKTFDLETLQRTESFVGTGRGRTTAFVSKQQGKERRVRALERLGLAEEASTLVDQISLTQADRKEIGDIASTQLTLAGKRLDLALGLQSELEKFDEQEKAEARSFILDVIDFSEGKTFEELDEATQSSILKSVADSPLTLSMVKTALENGAQGGDRLLNLSEQRAYGKPAGTRLSEVIGLSPKEDAPIVQTTGLDLTDTNQREIQQAGLTDAPENVQSYFINTPTAFRDELQRISASGEAVPMTIEEMIDSYTVWYEENKAKDSGDRDWGSIFE